MNSEDVSRVETALKPLSCLRMSLVQCDMSFDKMVIKIEMTNNLALFVILADNPVRAVIHMTDELDTFQV